MGNKHSVRPSDASSVVRQDRNNYSDDLQRQLSLELSLDHANFQFKLEGGSAFHGRMAPMPQAHKAAIFPVVDLQAYTWYRDSHGLFDYEEKEKITFSSVEATKNFHLIRQGDSLQPESFDDFRQMRKERKEAESPPETVATFHYKDDNYWIFHAPKIEDAELEKTNPGEKLWLVMRHMQNDQEHGMEPELGYKLSIGDTIKFGRVRYKVIMMHSYADGYQEYSLMDRFQKKRFKENLRASGIKKRRNRQSMAGQNRDSAISGNDVGSPEASGARIHHMPTQLEANRPPAEAEVDDDSLYLDSSSEDLDDVELPPDVVPEDLAENSDYNSASEHEVPNDDQIHVEEQADVENLDDVEMRRPAEFNDNSPMGSVEEGAPGDINRMQSPDQAGRDMFMPPYMDGQGGPAYASAQPAGSRAQRLDPFDGQARRTSAHGGFASGMPSQVMVSGVSNAMAESDMDPMAMGRKTSYFGNLADSGKRATRASIKKRKKHLKMLLAEKAKLKENEKGGSEARLCRICLGDENDVSDPLINPCKCAGSMGWIHLECLREWLNSKRSKKESESVRTYCWKSLECELCKERFPGQVFADGTIIDDKLLISKKKREQLGQPIEILEYDRPETDFLVLESVTLQNIRIVHVINMASRQFIRVGRGHDADIRVTDISVSRFHARINKCLKTGEFYVEDNKSKFGTLVQIRKPYQLQKNVTNYIQMGRTSLRVNLRNAGAAAKPKDSDGGLCATCLPCCKKTGKKVREKQLQLELYPEDWDSDSDMTDDANDAFGASPGIDNTRDEQQSQGANLSPEVRAPTAQLAGVGGSPAPDFATAIQPIPCEGPSTNINAALEGRLTAGASPDVASNEERKEDMGSGLVINPVAYNQENESPDKNGMQNSVEASLLNSQLPDATDIRGIPVAMHNSHIVDDTRRALDTVPIQKPDISAPNIAAPSGSFIMSGTNGADVSQRIGADGDVRRVMPLSEQEITEQLAQIDLSHTQQTEQLQGSRVEESKMIEGLASPTAGNAAIAGRNNAFTSFNQEPMIMHQSPIHERIAADVSDLDLSVPRPHHQRNELTQQLTQNVAGNNVLEATHALNSGLPQTHFMQPQKPMDLQVDLSDSHNATQQLGQLQESMNNSQVTNPAFMDGSMNRGKFEDSPGLQNLSAINVQNDADQSGLEIPAQLSPQQPVLQAIEEEEKKE